MEFKTADYNVWTNWPEDFESEFQFVQQQVNFLLNFGYKSFSEYLENGATPHELCRLFNVRYCDKCDLSDYEDCIHKEEK